MLVGNSSCQGILIHDTSIEGNNALYGYYKDDEIIIVEEEYKELQKQQKNDENIYLKQKYLDKILYRLFFMMILLCIISYLVCSFQWFIGILFFCICGYFPLLVLCYANINKYKNNIAYHQMRRYHGCEHALVKCISRHNYTLEKLKASSIYDSGCGTVYSGTFLLIIIYISFMIITQVSLLSILKNTAIVFVILFFNLFNPLNPFKLFQYRAVEKPTDKEYTLALKMLIKIHDENLFKTSSST